MKIIKNLKRSPWEKVIENDVWWVVSTMKMHFHEKRSFNIEIGDHAFRIENRIEFERLRRVVNEYDVSKFEDVEAGTEKSAFLG